MLGSATQCSNGNSKLQTAHAVYTQKRKKWTIRGWNLIAGIIQFLKNCNGKLKKNQLYFEILLETLGRKILTPNDPSKKKSFSFKKYVLLGVLTNIQIIALNKRFAFPVHLC